MDKNQAIKSLQRMVKSNKEAIERVKKKRSWRPSEKAMTAASFMEDNRALELAIEALKGSHQ